MKLYEAIANGEVVALPTRGTYISALIFPPENSAQRWEACTLGMALLGLEDEDGRAVDENAHLAFLNIAHILNSRFPVLRLTVPRECLPPGMHALGDTFHSLIATLNDHKYWSPGAICEWLRMLEKEHGINMDEYVPEVQAETIHEVDHALV